ncbi:MAG: tRNA (guanosine(37)-N1)-methyltransferase TrmD [Acidobacteria bacterium]|nr:tRNA (guanosine(37)-N1)-methyltransferase TrmD [Acidobacteriota bacterium]
MIVDILTIFPEMFERVFAFGIVGQALKAGLIRVNLVNPRDFTTDAHRTVDDRPFGGGEGMVFKPEPLTAAVRSLPSDGERPWVVCLSPQGRRVDQAKVRQLALKPRLALVCGRYEGIDQRFVDACVDEEISAADIVLSGGEIPAMMLVDAMTRLIPGAVGHPDSVVNESFENGLLDCPVYTRPADFEGARVPEVLLSGNHKRIAAWRERMALENTRKKRPDLLDEMGKNIKR